MGDTAGRGDGFYPVVLLKALQSIPEPDASAEQDRDQRDVHVVDEPCGKELAYHGGAPADAYVLAICGLAGRLERLGRGASRKWYVVPPSISMDGRVWWVRTKTGVWNGGLGPHAPFQSGSSCHRGSPTSRHP